MSQYDELEAKARAATQGEWQCLHDDEVWQTIPGNLGRYIASPDKKEDAAYIVAAQPSAVLGLIDRLRELEAGAGEPVAWILPGDDNESANGFIDARVNSEGEFTRPLYTAPPTHTALQARVRELEAKLAEYYGIISRLGSDSLDATKVVVGEGTEFAAFNRGQSVMRFWFLGQLEPIIGNPGGTK